MKQSTVFLIIFIFLSIVGTSQTKKKIINTEGQEVTSSRIVDMGANGFSIMLSSKDGETNLSRYSNTLELLWEATFDEIKGFGVLYPTPNGKGLYVCSSWEVIGINEKGIVTRTEITKPKGKTLYQGYADNEKVNLIYIKNYVVFDPGFPFSKKDEKLDWITITNNGEVSTKEVTLSAPSEMKGKREYWKPNHSIDDNLYLYRYHTSKKEVSFSEIMIINSNEKPKIIKINDPEGALGDQRLSEGEIEFEINPHTKRLYLNYVMAGGDSFITTCYDPFVKEIWSKNNTLKRKINFKDGDTVSDLKCLNNGDLFFSIKQSVGGGGVQTQFISKENGKLKHQNHSEYKQSAIERATNQNIGREHGLIFKYKDGKYAEFLSKRAQTFSEKNDLKVSTFYYFLNNTGDIIILMREHLKKSNITYDSQILTSIEMYLFTE